MTTATRRERQRAETSADIKAAAWADMAHSGTSDVSLRGVAREMGMAVSALYRYYASREDLITALVVDCFDELTARLRHAVDTAPADLDPGELFVRVGGAYRAWALAEPLHYRLAFGSPVDDYTGTADTTAATVRSSAVLIEVMARAVAADLVDTDRVAGLLTPELRAGLAAWSASLPVPLPVEALGACMVCYAALHGAIDLELNGHLPPAVRIGPALFETTLRSTVRSLMRQTPA